MSRHLEILYIRSEKWLVELEFSEVCAICEDEFADKNELKGHVNEIHQKSTSPTKPRRSAPPPKRFANQLFQEFKKYEIKKEESAAKQY